MHEEVEDAFLPVHLGDGVRLFGRPGYREAFLRTAGVAHVGDAAVLRSERLRQSPR